MKWALAFLIDMSPELMISWGLGESRSGDLFTTIGKSFADYAFSDKPPENKKKLHNKRYNSILKIGCLENIFGQMIEDFFKNFICTIEDELLIFFIKGQDKLLAIYKSYQPLLNDDKIRLPYWVYNIEAKKICTSLEKEFKKNETICILTYVIQ